MRLIDCKSLDGVNGVQQAQNCDSAEKTNFRAIFWDLMALNGYFKAASEFSAHSKPIFSSRKVPKTTKINRFLRFLKILFT